jgi:TRAP transporter TAXI family solute receptor
MFLLGVTVLSTTACGWNAEEPASAPRPPVVRVVHSWGDDTTYTEIIQTALTKSLKNVRVHMSGTNASVTNVFMLRRGEAEAVFTFSDAAYMASVGQIPGMPQPFEEIRAIAGLPTRAVQIVINPQSRIRSVPELRGAHVSLGPPGSGAALTSAFVLSAFGISLQDLNAERLEFREGARKVIAGGLDAAFWNGSFPNANIAEAMRHGARLLEVTGPDVERFRVEYPFLKPSVIPAGTYPGMDRPVHTVGVDGILVCRASLDESVVHELTRAFFEMVSRTDLGVRPLNRMNLSQASSTAIPLHPGAARYYRERELLR